MKKPEVIVETISSILPSGGKSVLEAKPSASLVTVKLHRDQSVQLDMSMPSAKTWADILETMQRAKQAVYLKIDPKTGLITDLLIPRVVKVATLKSNRKDYIEVELVISQMHHYLRRSNPDFKKLLKTLENALKTETPVLVTDSRDRREIIDVRPIPETVVAPGYLAAPLDRLVPEAVQTVKKRPQAGKGGAK
jgi:CheY-like chemotaxis protein